MAYNKTVPQSAVNTLGARVKPNHREMAKHRNAVTIEDFPPEQKLRLARELARRTAIETTSFSPIPPPDILQQYRDILPDAPDRIFTMAEQEQQFRAERQTSTFGNERKRIGTVLWLGFALSAVAGLAIWHGSAYIALGLAPPLFALLQRLMRRKLTAQRAHATQYANQTRSSGSA